MAVLVTGAAGFIGAAVSGALLARGDEVIGLDNLSAYYDVGLKRARVKRLEANKGFRFAQCDIADMAALKSAAQGAKIARIVHLAAQAGVRYSIENPAAYTQSNLVGHANVLELARGLKGVEHVVYASSSSVYGNTSKAPFKETESADSPVSFYGATKRANELMSASYAQLYGTPHTGLRFFTVYGPWGRPDMAYFSFTGAILKGQPIQVFNKGALRRDFTYIDDVVACVLKVADSAPQPQAHRIYNIGHSEPVELSRFIAVLEQAIGRKAVCIAAPMQAGDVIETYADMSAFKRDFGYAPATGIETGLPEFVKWYRDFYRV